MKNLLWLALLLPMVSWAADQADIDKLQKQQASKFCLGKVKLECAKTRLILEHETEQSAQDQRLDTLEAGGGGPTPLRFVLRNAASNTVGDFILGSFDPSKSGNLQGAVTAYFYAGGVAHVAQVGNDDGFIAGQDILYTTTDCSGTPYQPTNPGSSNPFVSHLPIEAELESQLGRGFDGILYYADYSLPPQNIAVSSVQQGGLGPSCTPVTPVNVWVYTAVQLVVPTFVPPFTLSIE